MVASLLACAAVAYYRFEPVREMVDTRCPWIKEQLAQRGIQFEDKAQIKPVAASVPQQSPVSTVPIEKVASTHAASETGKPSPAAQQSAATPANAIGTPTDMIQLAANHSFWPKVVKVKKTTVFPAVYQGKEIGKLSVPAGTEVKVISINPEKVAVAYTPDGVMSNAGGAYLQPEETDLFERVRLAHATN